jgi:GNAT superfamily N-acetyltransferase
MMSADSLVIRRVEQSDEAGFSSVEKFRRYLSEDRAGLRPVFVAILDGEVAGYVTLLWNADDPAFRMEEIAEISDLWVSDCFRCRGVGTALLAHAEQEAARRSPTVGLNVGLHSGYGAAQRIYVRCGYVPDGSGVVVEGEVVPEGSTIRLDDDPIVTLRMKKVLGVR